MTPEERAQAAWEKIQPFPLVGHRVVSIIANAIADAVKAERESIIELLQQTDLELDRMSDGSLAESWFMTRHRIINTIQDRNNVLVYDPDFGDFKQCQCGHHYYRHFDSYEGMRWVGCKYCDCYVFVLSSSVEPA